MEETSGILSDLLNRARSFNLELTRSDMALIRRSINNNWPISPDVRDELARRLSAIAADGTKSDSIRTAAARTLEILMDWE